MPAEDFRDGDKRGSDTKPLPFLQAQHSALGEQTHMWLFLEPPGTLTSHPAAPGCFCA